MKKFGNVILKLRKQHGLTQEQLGKKINVSYQAVSKWENNLSEPDLETIEKLTATFGLSIAEFFAMVDGEQDGAETTVTQPVVAANEPSVLESVRHDPKVTSEPHVQNVTAANEPHVNGNANTATLQPNTHGSTTNKAKNNARPWYLVAGLAVVIVALACCAIFIPSKYSNSQIFDMVNPSVFCITAEGNDFKSAGSGFFINNSGLAVTNYHVLKNCTSAVIQTNDGKKYEVKEIVGCDEDRDICIIQVDIKKSKGVKLANSDKVKVGDVIYAIGYPESFQLGSLDSTFTQGIISKTSYSYEGNTYIQATVDMTHGNSGGVLVNQKGEVVGITTLMLTDGLVNYMNMAIPINKVREVKQNVHLTLDEYCNQHKTFYFYSDGRALDSKDFISGEKISPISDPSKTGYAFGGWYTSTKFDVPFDFDVPVNTATACYAKWIANTYTIKFDGKGGVGNMNDLSATYDKSVTLPSNAFTLLHYTFVGWKEKDSGRVLSDKQVVNNLTSEDKAVITLEAMWEVQSYTVAFDGNNATSGSMSSVKVRYDQTMQAPQNGFTKTGYLFGGYSYNGQTLEVGQTVPASQNANDTITLSVVWNPITYTVRYECDGETPYEQTFTYDKAEKLEPLGFYKQYYNFEYWYCSELYQSFDDKAEVNNLTTTNGEVIVLSAWFTEFTYSVKFFVSRDDLIGPTVATYRYSQVFTTSAFISMMGYKFLYWEDENGKIYGERDENGKYVGVSLSKLTTTDKGEVNFYGVWEGNKYYVCYEYPLKGETIRTEPQQQVYDVEFELASPQYADDGYEFAKWQFVKYSTTKLYDANESVSKLTSTDNGTVTLVATYNPKKYTVNFDGNGATAGQTESISATFGSSVTLPQNNFVKDGYTLVGWDFNGQFYSSSTIDAPISVYTDSITFTARWIENLKGGGTIDNPYTISTLQDLNTFATLAVVDMFENKYVVLANDIDCNYTKLQSVAFAGVFDGKGHKLVNVDYLDGTLFTQNKGVIQNLIIENLKLEVENTDSNQTVSISGLVNKNYGFISRCYVSGSIKVTTCGDVFVYGLASSNYSNSYNTRKIEYCFTDLNVEVTATAEIEHCTIYGFANGDTSWMSSENKADYNYSILTLTANLTTVKYLYVNAFGAKSDHSFAKADINVIATNATYYSLNQTATYYTSDSVINVKIGGKPQLDLKKTSTSVANLQSKTWQEANLFDTQGVWLYTENSFPTPSFSYQTVIDTQEQFMDLKDSVLLGEYVLNCDVDLTGVRDFFIKANYGVFDGNGHVISNYKLTSNVEWRIINGLFEQNYGMIKNLGMDNVDIKASMMGQIKAAGLVIENYGTVNACFVKGKIDVSARGSCFAGGIVALSHNGKVSNCYTNVKVTAQGLYAGDIVAAGIVAYGNAVVENCFSLNDVDTHVYDATLNTVGAYGISGADGTVKNSFVLSDVKVTQNSAKGEFVALGISKQYENSFACDGQTITTLREVVTVQDKSSEELCSEEFLASLGFQAFTTQDNLTLNQNAVWVIDGINLPRLWFEVEN